MSTRLIRTHGLMPVAASVALALAFAADAQVAPGGGDTSPAASSARPSSPPEARPSSSTAQPRYPSSDRPRAQSQQEQRGDAGTASANTPMCNQEDELARSECLRRDNTDDDELPAGVTRSMYQRKQQAQQQAESTNVASEADTGSDQARGRSRTRTASSDLPGPQSGEERQEDQTSEAQRPDSEADNASDTLGRER